MMILDSVNSMCMAKMNAKEYELEELKERKKKHIRNKKTNQSGVSNLSTKI